MRWNGCERMEQWKHEEKKLRTLLALMQQNSLYCACSQLQIQVYMAHVTHRLLVYCKDTLSHSLNFLISHVWWFASACQRACVCACARGCVYTFVFVIVKSECYEPAASLQIGILWKLKQMPNEHTWMRCWFIATHRSRIRPKHQRYFFANRISKDETNECMRMKMRLLMLSCMMN